MKSVDKILTNIIELEGGYVNHPDDKGGPTNYGITEKVARDYGYFGKIENLPKILAKNIYLTSYWVNPNIDKVYEFSNIIAIELFDISVNIGPLTACKWLQRLLNVFNDTNLALDGIIGENTLRELGRYLKKREGQHGEETMCKGLNALQGNHYISLAEKYPSQKSFIYGWLRTRL